MISKEHSMVDEIHEGYRKGKSNLVTKSLDWMAREMLDKAKITKNVDHAKKLRALVDQSFAKEGKSEFDREVTSELFSLLASCFDVIIDDVIIASAFELHAKRLLLSQGYCVHDISAPSSLQDAQRGKKGRNGAPVHVKTIKASEARGVRVKFKPTTLGLSTLMSKSYAEKLKISQEAMRGLAEVRDRRNLVHFHTHFSWNVTDALLALVGHLNKAIPDHDVRKKKRSAI